MMATPVRISPATAPSSPLSDLSSTPSMLSPSSPLSALSRSPSLPPQTSSRTTTSTPTITAMDVSSRYPSPSSSSSSSALQSGCASPLKLPDCLDVAEIQVRTDGPPPAKRRKVTARKPRSTEHLDLDNRDDAGEAHLDRLLHVLRTKKKIVVIAGAGISVSAGIPDFRSSQGLFRTLQDKHKIKGGGKALFDASVYKDDKSTAEFHNMVRDLSRMTKEAKPTAFHHMLATIAHEGRLLRLYSQNVDCLDTSLAPLATTIPLPAKKPWPITIQVHGGLEKMQCTKCNHVSKFDGDLFQGPEPPLCGLCKEQDDVRTKFAGKRSHGVGRLRPRMVLYNEYNPDSEAIGSVSEADLKRVPDAVIVVGTSLKIPGVKRLVQVLCRATRATRDGFTAWINLDPEPQAPEVKDIWDLVVRGKSDDIASLLNLPQWDCEDVGPNKEEYMVSGSREKEERYEQRLIRDKLDVLIDSKKRFYDDFDGAQDNPVSSLDVKSKIVEKVIEEALPTPSASPRHGSPLPRKALPQRKTKQSTLDFSMSSNGTEPSTSKPAKKKSGRPKKEIKPKNEITKLFKATKVAPKAVESTKKPLERIKNEADPFKSMSSFKANTKLKSLPSLRPETDDEDHFTYRRASPMDPMFQVTSGEKGIHGDTAPCPEGPALSKTR